MPQITIPQTGTTIDWPPADAGRIRINAKLHLSDVPSKAGIGIELSFKRDPFRHLFKQSDVWCRLRSLAQREEQQASPLTATEQRHLDRCRSHLWDGLIEQLSPDVLLRRWGNHIACTLHDSMARPDDPQFTFYTVPTFKARSRKRLQIIEGYFQGIEYRLALDRDDLRVLHTAMATETGTSRLLFEVHWYLLPTALIDYALKKLPRGHEHVHIQQNLMAVAGCAVFVAEELLKKAAKDQAFRSRLQNVLLDEQCGRRVRKSLQVLTLADRALRPALVRYNIELLIGRDISDILDPATRTSLAELFKHFPDKLTWWFDLLLAAEGQAAHTLKLVK